MRSIAVYPGSFDPITNGHIDLLERALKMFDKVIIAIAVNPAKQPMFTLEERLDFIKGYLEEHSLRDRVNVDSFTGLLVDYVQSIPACTVVRGLRAISDFEYEFQMTLMNRKLNKDIETAFIMTGMRWVYISSSIVKDVACASGDLSGLVPEAVEIKLKEKFAKLNLNKAGRCY